MQKKGSRRKKGEGEDGPEGPAMLFGDIPTADHISLLSEENYGLGGETTAIVIKDRATRWVDCYPLKDKTAEEAERALRDCVGPAAHVGTFYSDNAPELVKAARDLKWHHDTATPGRPQTNGVAERAVRQVEEGARTVCERAGLAPKWLLCSVKHFAVRTNLSPTQAQAPWPHHIWRARYGFCGFCFGAG